MSLPVPQADIRHQIYSDAQLIGAEGFNPSARSEQVIEFAAFNDAFSGGSHAPSRLHFPSRRRVGCWLPRDRPDAIQGLPCRHTPPGPPVDEKSPLGAILLQKLEQHGYALGKNLAFEARGAGGQISKLGEIVRSMKADQVDVIVAGGFPTTLACKVANVPTVVFLGVGDPVATHLIDSLAHPGGNITGISDNAAALATKRLELIKQAVPKGRRVAMLWNRNDLGMSMRYEASADAARSLGVTVQPLGVRESDDFNGV